MKHIDPFDKVAHLLSHCHLKQGDPGTVILYRGDYRKAIVTEEIPLEDFLEGSFLNDDPHQKELWGSCLLKTFQAYLSAKRAGREPNAFSLTPMNLKSFVGFQREQIAAGYNFR